jgi:8-hydroxy-5-deazaflavin:NADPH oxidoreductase
VHVTVIGTGFIGGTLGRALSSSGQQVVFGSRHPESDEVAGGTGAAVMSVAESLAAPDVVILALPGGAVAELVAELGAALRGKLVIDATNQMGAAVANARAQLPADVRYARAFNTLGGENLADPVFAGGPADMFFSGPEGDRAAVEAVIAGVGLRPVYVGADQEATIDALFRLWIALAITQGRGRRLALRLLDS